jgi:hypothetical protein
MNLDLEPSSFQSVTEIWGSGPNEIVVHVTAKGGVRRKVKITAQQNLRSGATPGYFATYEEEVEVVDAHGERREVWALAAFPWQDGETPEACLRAALIWVSGA